MNKTEYLLDCLAEECCEVAVRVSKALRFTLEEAQPGQRFTNRERITQELIDLYAIVELLVDDKIINDPTRYPELFDIKKMKVHRFMDYSRERGCLS